MTSQNRGNVPLAIVGMACRLPGAENLDAYWQLLVEGRSAIGELPPNRFNRELFHDPNKGAIAKSYSTLAGLVKDRPVDRRACPLPEEWYRQWDPAHLNMCEVAVEACRHAGYDPFNLPQRNVGVYIGHACGSDMAGDMTYATGVEETAEYLRELEALKRLGSEKLDTIVREVVARVRSEKAHRNADGTPELEAAAVSLLVAKALGLNGPVMAIEAACASSLQALAAGARALHQGRIDMAIVGGASYCKTDTMVLFSQAQSVSARGSCPFDAGADGLITAEGYVTLLIKTLPQALADGDRIQAVIRGIGISSDGRGRSLWAPRKEGQIEAVKRAYSEAGGASRLQYIEAHATSTQVGDATEMTALATVLAPHFSSGKKVPIGSVKSNIGHTLEVAGMAGLVKTVLAMQHGTIPPSINCRQLNQQIPWDQAPFYVAQKALPWDKPADGTPRRAAVNAFGIGGLNVHLVVDEFQPQSAKISMPAGDRNGSNGHEPAAVERGVAIIGAGAILPGAATLKAFWELLTSGRSAVCEVPPNRWNAARYYEAGSRRPWRSPSKVGGFITDYAYDWKKHKVPPKQVEHANPLQFMLLDAADHAFRDAGYYGDKKFDRSRVGVVVGTLFGGDFTNDLQMGLRLPEFQNTLAGVLRDQGIPASQISQVAAAYQETFLKHMPALLDETGSFTSSTLASRITKTFDLMGGAYAIDAGPASSLAALSNSVDLLLDGVCDMVVCAGGQRSMDLYTYEGFALNGQLTGGRPRAAFDAAGDGMVPGEGAGVLLLKRLADARRDGDKILGIIRGVGSATTAENPANTMKLAIERALNQAGVSSSDVAVLETANGADADLNAQEAAAILDTYGARSRPQPLLITSNVAQTGDLGAVAGIASVLKASMALEHRFVPATVGLEKPLPTIAENARIVKPVTTAMPVPPLSSSGRFFAGVNVYAPFGVAYHVIVERGTPVPGAVPAAAPAPAKVAAPAAKSAPAVAASSSGSAWRIVQLSGPSVESLAEQAGRLVSTSDSLFATAERSHFTGGDPARLAIVADNAMTLATKLRLASEQLKSPTAWPVLEEQGIYCRQKLPAAKVAFLFPGQGSQYAGMLSDLVRQAPAAAAAMKQVDAAMAKLGYPSFAEIAWNDTAELGSNVWRTQVSMLLADTIMHSVLSSWNIRPDCVSGHSYGEFPALVAAGAWSLEQCIVATKARCDAVEASRTGHGSLLSTTASPDMVERIGAAVNGAVYISSHNAPDQTVVGGDRNTIADMAKKLEERGYEARVLAVPRPFHTPLMADVKAPLRHALERIAIEPPRTPMLSSVTNRYVAEPDDIRDNLVAQMTNPVRYVALVERLAREGVNVLIEVGPQQVLTRLHRRILTDRNIAAIASDNSKRPGIEQLYRIRALLACLGVGESVAGSLPAAIPSARVAEPIVSPATKPLPSIEQFDATALRRERRRQSAGSNGSSPARLEPARRMEQPAPAKTNGHASVAPGPTPSPGVAGSDVSANGERLPASPRRVEAKKSSVADNLEAFLVNFVVEQTGYPPEIVELDADLEADLGIDSIKKAQLFGELREYFDITPASGTNGQLSLDQFPTLRHVLNFLRGDTRETSSELTDAKPQAASVAVSATKTVPAVAELERFLVNFVVEQTGYPPEIVELDADLEADLGIDSIKKAQLFGELREYFDITPSGGQNGQLSLDQFPTLRHVLDFLSAQPGKSEWLGNGKADAKPQAVSEALVAVNSAPATGELEAFLVNFVVEQTGYPPEIVELDADLEADLGIDSIKKAQLFGELREYFDITPAGGQNGQLSLDQFPTLRHVLNFLQEATGRPGEAGGDDAIYGDSPPASPGLSPANQPARESFSSEDSRRSSPQLEPEVDTATATATTGAGVLQLAGTPHEMGVQHGRACVQSIRALLRRVADLADDDLELVAPLDRTLTFGAAELDEMRGIAEAVGVHLDNIVAHNRRRFVGLEDCALRVLQVRRPNHGPAESIETVVGQIPRHAPSGDIPEVLSRRAGLNGSANGAAVAKSRSPGSNGHAPAAPAKPQPLTNLVTPDAFEKASTSVGGLPPMGDPNAVCHRFVMRLMDQPAAADALRKPFAGPAVIVGDNPVARALRSQLASRGVQSTLLPESDDATSAILVLERTWQNEPAPHLFLLTAADADAEVALDPEHWQRQMSRGAMLPILVLQRWHQLVQQAGLLDQASVMALGRLGGGQGFAGDVSNIIGGAMSGLIKALHLEVAGNGKNPFCAKLVDVAPGESAERVASLLIDECELASADVEVGYVNGRRLVPRPVLEPIESQARHEIRRGGTWIVTGGARGITASCARDLAERYGLRLHLLGTSPPPGIDPAWRDLSPAAMRELRTTITRQAMAAGQVPIDAWKRVEKAIEADRNLRSLAAAGIVAHYHQCDVADRDSLGRVLDEIRASDGPIEGIIHGAGVEAACLLPKKKRDMIEKTVATKVGGAANLIALTCDDPVRYFVAFGSASSCFGSVGQTDYCLANGMLAKLMDWYRSRRPDCHAVTIMWHSWDEVGMAARPETQHMYKLHGMRFLPTREGAEHMIAELEIGTPEREVLVTDWRYYKFFFPDRGGGSGVSAPGVSRESQEESRGIAPSAGHATPVETSRPAVDTPTVARRYVMRTVDAPLVSSEVALAGPAIVLGDNADARALASHIESLGFAAHVLPADRSIEETVATVEQLWAREPLPHLFIMTGRDAEAAIVCNRESWLGRRRQGIELPFFVCQKWYQLVAGSPLAERATLAAAVSLGGDFGFTAGGHAPEGGALAGLAKALHVETHLKNWQGLKLKVIDAPVDTPSGQLAEHVLVELAGPRSEIEVAYVHGHRRVVRAVAELVPAKKLDIHRGGTWLVTGGARGISAATALELGRRFGLKLNLIGSSPAPEANAPWRNLDEEQLKQFKKTVTQQALAEGKLPSAFWSRIEKDIEIEKNLRAMAAAGVKGTYHSCDVADWDALARTLNEVRRIDGPIEGVIHGAGVAKGAHFERKTRDLVEEMLGIRLDATIALGTLTRHDPLRYFIGFGSISGRFGVNGGADYSLASDMVCKLARWFRNLRPDCQSVAFHWHPWGEVGQMVRSVNFGTTDVMKVRNMPPAEAIQHLVSELEAGAPESEVLLTNEDYYRKFYPDEIVIDDSVPAPIAATAPTPLITSISRDGDRLIGAIRLDPVGDPFLVDHRFKGQPLLPAAIGIEALAEAAETFAPGRQVVGLRDVQLVTPLRFFSDRPMDVRVRAERRDGAIFCDLVSDFTNRAGKVIEADRVAVRGVVELGDIRPVSHVALGEAPDAAAWFDVQYLEGLAMFHGPVFRCLRQAAIDNTRGWGRVEARPIADMAGSRPAEGWRVAAHLFDACLFACGVHVWFHTNGGVSVPESFRSIRLGRQPRADEMCKLRLDFRGQEGHFGRFDFTLVGADDAMIFQVEGYQNVIVQGTAG